MKPKRKSHRISTLTSSSATRRRDHMKPKFTNYFGTAVPLGGSGSNSKF